MFKLMGKKIVKILHKINFPYLDLCLPLSSVNMTSTGASPASVVSTVNVAGASALTSRLSSPGP